MKKILLFIVALLGVVQAWSKSYTLNGIYYYYDDESGNAKVTSGQGVTGSIVIPNVITIENIDYPVVSIAENAFAECTEITSIVIPNSVTTIEAQAFLGCSSLASITFSENLERIGISAFYRTAWLNNQPDGLVYTGKVAYTYL